MPDNGDPLEEQAPNVPPSGPAGTSADKPPEETTPQPTGPQVDVRRLLLIIAVCIGGLGYVFWDDVRDIIKPPKIIEPTIPADALLEDHEQKVKAGVLDITFTKVGAAITHLTWTNPQDGHVETLILKKKDEDDLPNRAFVVTLPGHEEWAGHLFRLESKPITRKVKDGTVTVTEVKFVPGEIDDEVRLTKTFLIRHDKPLIELEVEIGNIPAGDPIREKGYTLKVSNGVGIPAELDKDDGLITVRCDNIADHHPVRRVSGAQEWPTEDERERAAHGHGLGTPTLEWVATATRYFGLIVRPERPLRGAEMTLTRTDKCAAAVELRTPPSPDAGFLADIFRIYAGPKKYDDLVTLPGRQQESINYWYFGRLATLLLQWVHGEVVQNYGMAIIIVTIIFRLLMWPVTRFNLRAMVDLKLANARLEEIDAREPPRSQKEARAEWLKDARVWEKVQSRATIGAFLPMVILLPALLVLYYTLNAGYEFYRQPFALWITDISRRDPYFVLPVLMGLAMMGQLRTMSENPSKERSWIFMPVAFTIIFAFFSAGLVLFWFVDTLAGWGQLAIIKRGRKRKAAADAGQG